MRDENGIEAAAKRLIQAIDALAAAVERRREADREEERLAEQLQALGTDRSRLAAELDAAAASARRLKTANREVAQRLDAAIETIHSVLDAGEQ
jgi:chromosome segregation ATPase